MWISEQGQEAQCDCVLCEIGGNEGVALMVGMKRLFGSSCSPPHEYDLASGTPFGMSLIWVLCMRRGVFEVLEEEVG